MLLASQCEWVKLQRDIRISSICRIIQTLRGLALGIITTSSVAILWGIHFLMAMAMEVKYVSPWRKSIYTIRQTRSGVRFQQRDVFLPVS